jgi:hypothetical protein
MNLKMNKFKAITKNKFKMFKRKKAKIYSVSLMKK